MRQVDVMIARFPGNNQEHPDSSNWVIDTMMKMQDDPRVGRTVSWHKADTPIDMVRNQAVDYAQQKGVDILFMIDNDVTPDTKGGGKFYETAMDFLYGRIPPAVIAAPYVGGGIHNNIFVFLWRNLNNGPQPHFTLEQYTREEAADQTGITEVAALPTGLIAYDMRVFDRLKKTDPGYFYYEMNDTRTEKQSTEDVTNTRDISLAWRDMEGAGCFCAWDCWASHNKIVPCDKPHRLSPSIVGDQMQYVFERQRQGLVEQVMDVGGGIQASDIVKTQRAGENGKVSHVGQEQILAMAEKVQDEFKDINGGIREDI